MDLVRTYVCTMPSIHTCTYVHTYIHTYIPSPNSGINLRFLGLLFENLSSRYWKRRVCTEMVHTHIHTYMYTYLHIYTYIYTYITCLHTYIHTYTHTHIHTCIHTYIQTYIHTKSTYVILRTHTFTKVFT